MVGKSGTVKPNGKTNDLEIVERYGAKPGKRLKRELEQRHQKIEYIIERIVEVAGEGHFPTQTLQQLARVFLVEQRSFEYLLEGEFRKAAALLFEQGQPDAAIAVTSLVHQA